MIAAHWDIRLSADAENDFVRIIEYSIDAFGERQTDLYRGLIFDALSALAAGPDVAGSIGRDDIRSGLRSLHITRQGRRGRHFIVYRAAPDNVIVVLRILHDAMDLARHIPN